MMTDKQLVRGIYRLRREWADKCEAGMNQRVARGYTQMLLASFVLDGKIPAHWDDWNWKG